VALIRIKRAYDPPESADGTRVLVDRLWPRGLAKADAQVDVWAKDAAPSNDLRHWFAHDVARWLEFRARYRAELANNPGLGELRRMAAQATTLTLLFAAKDAEHNNAVVLRDVLRETD
jgi:uncharacterized protein YeaO (DUF488 family)